MTAARQVLSAIVFAAISLAFVFVSAGPGQAKTEPGQKDNVHKVHKHRVAKADTKKGKHRVARKAPSQTGPSPFDGGWTVSLNGVTGECQGHSLTYMVDVRNGRITYGGGDASVSGRISPSGATFIRVASGDRIGNASGHVSRSSGGGSFQGQVSGNPCSGSWRASHG
jgi:hypothetical protein